MAPRPEEDGRGTGGVKAPPEDPGSTLTPRETRVYSAQSGIWKTSHGGTMSEIPEGFLYTEEHEYLRPGEDDGVYFVGVTDYAQGELGDVVFVELPEPGATFEKMEAFGTIEAVKAVSDLFCPVKAEVLEVNSGLDDEPALVNSDPYGDGWMIKIRVVDEAGVAELMDGATYAEHVGG